MRDRTLYFSFFRIHYCYAVCCSELQCLAVCCCLLLCVAMRIFLDLSLDLSFFCIHCCVAVCCSVLQCVAVCCSVLQCVAVCCCVLQCLLCVPMRSFLLMRHRTFAYSSFEFIIVLSLLIQYRPLL